MQQSLPLLVRDKLTCCCAAATRSMVMAATQKMNTNRSRMETHTLRKHVEDFSKARMPTANAHSTPAWERSLMRKSSLLCKQHVSLPGGCMLPANAKQAGSACGKRQGKIAARADLLMCLEDAIPVLGNSLGSCPTMYCSVKAFRLQDECSMYTLAR